MHKPRDLALRLVAILVGTLVASLIAAMGVLKFKAFPDSYILVVSMPMSAMLAFYYIKQITEGAIWASVGGLIMSVIVLYAYVGLFVFLFRPCC